MLFPAHKMQQHTHTPWFPAAAAGVVGGILIHNVALSGLHSLEQAMLGVVPSADVRSNWIGAAGLVRAGLSMAMVRFLLRSLDREVKESHTRSSSNRLLDTALVRSKPGFAGWFQLVALGLFGVFFLVCLHGLAHAVWHVLAHGLHLHDALVAGVSTVLVLLLAEYYRKHHRVHVSSERGDPGPNDAVIVFLSKEEPGALPQFAGVFERIRKGEEPLPSVRWEMPARSIVGVWKRHHLKDVVVIGSGESWPQIPQFVEMIQRELRDGSVSFHCWPPGGRQDAPAVDFFDYEEVDHALQSAIRFLEARGRQRIALDITSGTKICSAAGFSATLPSGRGALYVNVKGVVFSYDFTLHGSGGWVALPHEGPSS